MKNLVKLAMVAAVLALSACAASTQTDATGTEPAVGGQRVDCSTVRCAACPEGQTPALKPSDCCRCVPVDKKSRDCSTVRCAACPEGQHPALTPPECCRCVPD
jgi:hypothetical protein